MMTLTTTRTALVRTHQKTIKRQQQQEEVNNNHRNRNRIPVMIEPDTDNNDETTKNVTVTSTATSTADSIQGLLSLKTAFFCHPTHDDTGGEYPTTTTRATSACVPGRCKKRHIIVPEDDDDYDYKYKKHDEDESDPQERQRRVRNKKKPRLGVHPSLSLLPREAEGEVGLVKPTFPTSSHVTNETMRVSSSLSRGLGLVKPMFPSSSSRVMNPKSVPLSDIPSSSLSGGVGLLVKPMFPPSSSLVTMTATTNTNNRNSRNFKQPRATNTMIFHDYSLGLPAAPALQFQQQQSQPQPNNQQPLTLGEWIGCPLQVPKNQFAGTSSSPISRNHVVGGVKESKFIPRSLPIGRPLKAPPRLCKWKNYKLTN